MIPRQAWLPLALLAAAAAILIAFAPVDRERVVSGADRPANLVALTEAPQGKPIQAANRSATQKADLFDAHMFAAITKPDGLLSAMPPASVQQIETIFSESGFALVRYSYGQGQVYAVIDSDAGEVRQFVGPTAYVTTQLADRLLFIEDGSALRYYQSGMSGIAIVPGSVLDTFPAESFNSADGAVVVPKLALAANGTISIAVFKKLKMSDDEKSYVTDPDRNKEVRKLLIQPP